MSLKKILYTIVPLAVIAGGVGYYYYSMSNKNMTTNTSTATAANTDSNIDPTLVYCIKGSPVSLSPAKVANGVSYDASSRVIFDRLFENKPGSIQIVPALATGYKVSDDGLTYTVYLRKGVNFNDNQYFTPTRDFDADDVVFTFNRILDPNNPYHNVNSASYPYWYAMNFPDLIDSVTKVNQYTVQFKLKHPDVTFIPDLSMDFLSIYSAEYAKDLLKMGHPEYIDLYPIGTGPWKLVNYIPDTSIKYVANPTYWRGESKIKTLIYSITPDGNARIAKLITGTCDIIDRPANTDLSSIIKKYNIKVNTQVGLNTAYIALNNDYGPLQNPLVRKALNLAIDKQAIAKAVYNNQVTVDGNILTPLMNGYVQRPGGVQYNPAEAKKLLAEAGYPNGFKITIFVQPVARTSNPSPQKTAELIQQDWNKIGVETTLKTTDYQQFLKQTRAGDYQAGTYGWSGDNGTTDNFLTPLLGSQGIGKTNYSRFNNPQFDKLINQARVTQNKEERDKLYNQAEEIFFEQNPVIVIGHAQLITLMNQNVMNYQQTPFGFIDFYGVWKKKENKVN